MGRAPPDPVSRKQAEPRADYPFLLSPHVSRLVEPFAGSAAISLATAYRRLADRFLVNDAHTPVIDLWREIIDRPEELAAKYRRLWQAQLGQEREYYDTVRKKFNEIHKPEYFLYLLARCVKAAIRYTGEGVGCPRFLYQVL